MAYIVPASYIAKTTGVEVPGAFRIVRRFASYAAAGPLKQDIRDTLWGQACPWLADMGVDVTDVSSRACIRQVSFRILSGAGALKLFDADEGGAGIDPARFLTYDLATAPIGVRVWPLHPGLTGMHEWWWEVTGAAITIEAEAWFDVPSATVP